MKIVEPKLYIIGETRIIEDQLELYLRDIGVPEWKSDASNDAETLIEVMGRLCYRSFKPGLNPNVVKIREHNDEYIGNIINVRHGSVIEHPMVNMILTNVSRVFTHELVRHRVGVAISQESLRFVRLDELHVWIPKCFSEFPDLKKREEILQFIVETVEILEERQRTFMALIGFDDAERFQALVESLGFDPKKDSFTVKKKFTSGMRRFFASDGVATSIGWSVNPRALRHIIEMRTAPGAEEEIRLVFGKIAEAMIKRYPNLFGDYTVERVDGYDWYKTQNQKV